MVGGFLMTPWNCFKQSMTLMFLAAGVLGCGKQSDSSRPAPETVELTLSLERLDPKAMPKQSDQSFAAGEKTFTTQGVEASAAISFTGSIAGCVSGYTLTLNETTPRAKLQTGDRGCIFRLQSLSTGSHTFDLANVPAESWQRGQSFSVTSREGKPTTFWIQQQIKSPISGSQQAAITFSFVSQDDDLSPDPNTPVDISITGPTSLPLRVQALDVLVSGDTNTLGFGVFTLDLACSAEGGTTVVNGNFVCGGIILGDLRAGLKPALPAVPMPDLGACRSLAIDGAQGNKQGATFANGAPGFPTGGLRFGPLVGPGRLYDPAHSKLAIGLAGPVLTSGCTIYGITIAQPAASLLGQL